MLLVNRKKDGLGLLIGKAMLRLTAVAEDKAVLVVEKAGGEKLVCPLTSGQKLFIGKTSVQLVSAFPEKEEARLAISAPKGTVIKRESYLSLPQRR